GSLPLWSLIRDDKLVQLPSLMQRGRNAGMIQIESSLAALLEAGAISRDTARRFADDPRRFAEAPNREVAPSVGEAAKAPVAKDAERSGIQDLVGKVFRRKS